MAAKDLPLNKYLPHLSRYRAQSRNHAHQRYDWLPEGERQQLARERYADAGIISRRGEFMHDLAVSLRHRIESGDIAGTQTEALREETTRLLGAMPKEQAEHLFGEATPEAVLRHLASEANRMTVIRLGEQLCEMPSVKHAEAQRSIERTIIARDLCAHPAFGEAEAATVQPHAVVEDLKSHLSTLSDRRFKTLRDQIASATMHSPSTLNANSVTQALCRTEIALKDAVAHAEKAEPRVRVRPEAMAVIRGRRNRLSHGFEVEKHDVGLFAHPDFTGRNKPFSFWVKAAEDKLISGRLGEIAVTDGRQFQPTVHGTGIVGEYTAKLISSKIGRAVAGEMLRI